MTKKEKAEMVKYKIALKRIVGYCTSNLCYKVNHVTYDEIGTMRKIAQKALDTKEILFPTESKFYKEDGEVDE